MAQPPFGATGLDTSDPTTLNVGGGMLAPSSMGASEGFRAEVSAAAIDRPRDDPDDDSTFGPDEYDLTVSKATELLGEYSSQSKSYFETVVHRTWARSYKAYRNEHFDGSIYLRDEYRTRSKIFKPKTRSALRKQMATTAKAMFSTGDVVSVTAEDDTNQQQVQAAALKQALVSYRLGTSTLRNGIPWFLIVSGARFDAQMTGICCSKQFWNFKEIDTGETEDMPSLDPATRQPTTTTQPKKLVLIDKPDVLLLAPENVRFDANCNWTNPAQFSPYLIVQYPMPPAEAYDMIQQNQKAKIPWLNVTLDELKNAAGDQPTSTMSPRYAREGGRDPQQQATGPSLNCWLSEVFIRHEGRDYVFWAIRDRKIISMPTPVEKVYPHLSGERPIVIGMGQLEPHRTTPMSAVESWQQTQAALNDETNLRLDHLKQIVSPPMKVMRGRKVDLAQVQRKAQNAIIMVNDMGDVEPMAMPDTPGSAFQEASMMSTDMDDLAGNFDTSSVQSNQTLNETVGGMHLLSESANQVSDFDLSVWNETWCQPVVSQIIKLEEYYETDEKVLTICGQRASLWDKFGVSEITDEMLRSESTIKVNLGIGATSLPMERLKRFSVAWDTSAKALAPFVSSKLIEVVPDAEAIVDDVFTAGGFKDGGKRFFKYVGPPQQPAQPPPPDPKAQAALLGAQAKMQSNTVQQEKNQATALLQAHQLNASRTELRSKLISDAADRHASIDIAHMRAMAEMAKNERSQQHEGTMQAHDHIHDHTKNFIAALNARMATGNEGEAPGAKMPGGTRNVPNPDAPQLAPVPSPHLQPQAGLYATLEDHP